MKSFTVICLFVVLALVQGRPKQYTEKYDKINLDEILGNQRLLIPYIKCILDEGVCTAEGNELKSHIRDALESDCSKCTEAQKNGVRRVIGHLINKEPEYWKQMCAKYDPNNVYTVKYEKELREASA